MPPHRGGVRRRVRRSVRVKVEIWVVGEERRRRPEVVERRSEVVVGRERRV